MLQIPRKLPVSPKADRRAQPASRWLRGSPVPCSKPPRKMGEGGAGGGGGALGCLGSVIAEHLPGGVPELHTRLAVPQALPCLPSGEGALASRSQPTPAHLRTPAPGRWRTESSLPLGGLTCGEARSSQGLTGAGGGSGCCQERGPQRVDTPYQSTRIDLCEDRQPLGSVPQATEIPVKLAKMNLFGNLCVNRSSQQQPHVHSGRVDGFWEEQELSDSFTVLSDAPCPFPSPAVPGTPAAPRVQLHRAATGQGRPGWKVLARVSPQGSVPISWSLNSLEKPPPKALCP